MKKPIVILTSLFLLFWYTSLQAQVNQYLDADPPGLKPKVFAPGLISMSDRFEFGSVFSPDGQEFYYAVIQDGKESIWSSQYQKGKWSTPKVVIEDEKAGFNDPFLSPDGSRLYYISKYRKEPNSTRSDYDIWYSERQGEGWSEPINAGPRINTPGNEYYISFTAEGTMYFSTNHYEGNHNIYRSEMKGGSFQKAVKESASINTAAYEADVFIAPDESYIIFAGSRSNGLGRGDLYISFKENGTWTQAKNMGKGVNSANHELCPYVTYDGKYLLYTSDGDIYWVSTEVFEKLR